MKKRTTILCIVLSLLVGIAVGAAIQDRVGGETTIIKYKKGIEGRFA